MSTETPTGADLLRRGAGAARHDAWLAESAGDEWSARTHDAVADWLEWAAERTGVLGIAPVPALAVARAYLGRES